MSRKKQLKVEKKYTYSEVGVIIKEIRKKKGLTQSQLGKILGCTGANVQKIEIGKSLPTTKQLIVLSDLGEMLTDRILRREVINEAAQDSLSETENKIKNLISKFQEQASLVTKRHLVDEIDFLLKVKVDE